MKRKYISRRVNEEIPAIIQFYIWEILEEHIKEKKGNIDYLQIFEFENYTDYLLIRHHSEIPKCFKEYKISKNPLYKVDDCKIYVIDNSDYMVMLFPEER